jgi:hypothetical protein
MSATPSYSKIMREQAFFRLADVTRNIYVPQSAARLIPENPIPHRAAASHSMRKHQRRCYGPSDSKAVSLC